MPTDEESRVLRDLLRVASWLQVPTLAVGANARQLILDQPYGLPVQRLTVDWDFGAQVESWQQYRAFTERLVELGGFRKTSVHSFTHVATGIPVDVVPFGKIAGRDATIEWPETERRMSVLGFEAAFERAEEVEVAGQRLLVTTLSWQVVLRGTCPAWLEPCPAAPSRTSRDPPWVGWV